ncbi:ABC transporter substrate-binding protein [Lederbergia lenta]|uniref:Polysaccharide ABC transporter substrate-binding protein n=1 Tax=Lederbergia lenta TaxID=1467 RepID=A0A2X4WPM4_LEDLE|nr:ABC transporter substrate-binding protein [Lederbergia lenta]MEC2324085.1 ABC transporter substrate-binding protein [Lederbergia lenta]SQI60642.1 polysaccharide ABC transporter substrate-binding protein [Lederbergia lenta]
MKMFKKVSGLIVFAIVLSVMVACQGKNEGASKNAKESSSGTSPIELTVFDADANSDWEKMESPVGKKIKEATGVTLKPEFDINGGQQKIALMAASGEYPDLIVPKGEARTLVDAEALIDLTDLIEEHAPNLKKMYGEDLNRLKWSKEDPSIYILSNAPVDATYYTPGMGVGIQHDVVKDLGYPEMRTLEDYEKAIKEYVKKYPEIDGQKTIGLSLLADDWRIQPSTLNSGFWATGGSDDGEYYIDPETHEATLHYRRPAEKDYFRWLNHMNDEGLLDKESFVQKYDQYLAKLSSGRVLSIMDPDWSISQAQNALRDSGKHERMYGMYPVTLSEEYKHHNFQSPGYQVGWGIGITVDCEDPVRAIKFLDYLASDEAQVMTNWGIEGEHYEIVDGKRVIPADVMEQRDNDKDFAKETGIGYNFQRFAPRYGDGAMDSTGQTYTIASPDQIKESYTDTEKEVLDGYGVEFFKDLYPQEDEFEVKPWGAAYNIQIPAGSDLELINQKVLDLAKKRVPEAILAKPADFDKVWDAFMEDLIKAGVEQGEEEFTKLVQETVELWSE